MSVASAITALSPNLWYKLDETSGTTASNSGSLANNGTYSGSYQQGLAGPEQGTFATRLFSGGQILSNVGMDVTTLTNYSIGAFLSTDASGLTGTVYPIISIGDPANRQTRGPALYETHLTVQTPRYAGAWWPTASTSATVPQPVLFWHWMVVTFTTGTNGMKLYLDGTLISQTTISGPVAAQSTDRLLIKCDEPMAVAHVCFWGTILSQAQIQSVSNQITPWPPNQPINTDPTGGGGGGGLTEDQAAQLTAIDTKTDALPGITDAVNFISDTVNHIKGVTDATLDKVNTIGTDVSNIVNTLFPQLADVLNDIGAQLNDVQNAVRGTVKQGTDWLTKTVGELLSRGNATDLNYASLSGGPTCSPIEVDVSGNHLYGIRLEITAYPPEWKFRTPDLAWSLKDLAVIRVYRNGKLEARQGVHTIVHTWEPIPQPGYPYLGIFPPVQTPGTVITVDFAEGVCGNLIGEEFPGA